MSKELSALDQAILGFVERYIDEHKMAPLMREIGEGVGRTKSTIFRHVQLLKEREYLVSEFGQERSIRPGPMLRR